MYIYGYACVFVYTHVSIYLSIFLSIYLSTYLSTYIYIYIYVYLYLYIHAYIHTYIHTYIYLSIYLFIYLYIHPCIAKVESADEHARSTALQSDVEMARAAAQVHIHRRFVSKEHTSTHFHGTDTIVALRA